MNDQWDPDRWQRYAMRFAQKFGRQQEQWARRAGAGMNAALRGGKMLADGDLRLIVLALLDEGPRHGYDIIKALEEKSGGLYSPSPGVVYPTLTYLEEAGYATASTDGNKRVYTITDAGRDISQGKPRDRRPRSWAGWPGSASVSPRRGPGRTAGHAAGVTATKVTRTRPRPPPSTRPAGGCA